MRTRLVAAVLGLGLLLRLVYFLQVREQPFFLEPMLDGEHYHAWAREIAGGDWLGRERGVFVMSPGYPYLLGLLYRVTGPSVAAVAVLQMLAGLATGGLLFLLGRRLHSPAAGLAAAGLYLANPVAIFFEGVLEKAAVVNLLNTAVLALAAGGGPTRLLAAGLLTGLSAQIRPNALILVPLLLLWALRREPRRGRAAALLCAGVAAALLPAAARNLAVGGEPVLTTAHGGMNLYTGNNPSFRGPYTPLPFAHTDPAREQEDFRVEASRRAGRELTRAESDAFWAREAGAFVRERPGRALGNLLRKALVFIHGYEQPINLDFSLFRELGAPLLSWPLPGWAVLLPLAAAGIVLAPPNLLTGGYLLGYFLSGLVFFVVSEYRFAAAPALALCAGAGLASLPRLLRERRLGRIAAAAGVLLVALVLSRFDLHGRVLGLPGFPRRLLASSLYNYGTLLVERGRADDAVRVLERSSELGQGPLPLQVLGDIALARGDRARAIGLYRESLRRAPVPQTWNKLGLALAAGSDLPGAEAAFREAVRVPATAAEPRFNLAVTLDRQGRHEEALGWYEDALRLHPGHAEASNNAGVILDRLGRPADARARYEAALRARPDYAEAANNLGRSLLAQGRAREALALLHRAVRLAPGLPEAWENLGRAQEALGRAGEAEASAERARRIRAGAPTR